MTKPEKHSKQAKPAKSVAPKNVARKLRTVAKVYHQMSLGFRPGPMTLAEADARANLLRHAAALLEGK